MTVQLALAELDGTRLEHLASVGVALAACPPSERPTPRDRRHASRRLVSGGAHVYLRRRIAAGIVLTLVVLGAWVLVRALGSVSLDATGRPGQTIDVSRAELAGFSPSGPGPDQRVHVVRTGETFWSIARSLDPGADPRPLVDRLIASHGSTRLRAGDVLVLPS